MMTTKSGPRPGRASEPNSLFKSLKFLKPTLRIEPPNVSNLQAVSIVIYNFEKSELTYIICCLFLL